MRTTEGSRVARSSGGRGTERRAAARRMIIALLLAVLEVHVVDGQDEGGLVDGFRPSKAAYDHSLIDELDRRVESETYKEIGSVVVIRDGQLLIERYYNGAARDRTHNPRSVGKTFAAAVLGVAIRDGHLRLDQTLGDFYDLRSFDNYTPEKAEVTLLDLVTMTSGFDGFDFDPESVGNEEWMYPQENWVEWTLSLPMAGDRSPGDEWRYFTAGVVVLGDILNRSVPGGLESYAHEVLFQPLGITNYEWQHTPQRVANTAGGVQLTPLGFAKFGQLYKNGGRWDGVGSDGSKDEAAQVLPKDWVEASLTPLVETTEAGNRYGYLWWHRVYEVGGESHSVAYCSGNGGNKIFVFDELPLVIVVTASAYGRRYAHSQVDELLQELVLPAVLVGVR